MKIEKLDNFGRGITFVDGKITFVPLTIPGDSVDIIITNTHKKYNEAKLVKIIKPSSKRIEPICPYFNICGGCCLQTMSYEDSFNFKVEKVESILLRNKINYQKISYLKNPKQYNYRNKISLKIVNKEIGFYSVSTHKLVPISSCLLASSSINKMITYLHLLNIQNGEITIRSNYNDEIILVIDTDDEIKDIPVSLAKDNKLIGIILNGKTIYGENHFIEIVNGILYEVSYDSFFQVNLSVAQKLFDIVKDNATGNILDLYCGVGALSLQASKKATSVIGVEIVKNAVINAINNRKINKINNAEFILKDLSDGLNLEKPIDTVIIDPPRSGVDSKTMNYLTNNLVSKIIYVSCDPITLARDLKILSNYYDVASITIADMFSYTYHVETVAILKTKNNG